MTDYYTILGVARDSSHAEVKRAYHKLAKQYHPDLSKKPEDRRLFDKIAEAYRILGNREKRESYDRELLISEQFSRMQKDIIDKAKKEVPRRSEAGRPAARTGSIGKFVKLAHASALALILSILVGLLLTLDYSMPTTIMSDTLYYKQSGEGNVANGHTAIFTTTDRVEVGHDLSDRFPLGSIVVVEKTALLGNIVSVELLNDEDRLLISERISPWVILLPFVLLAISLGTYVARNRPVIRIGLLSVYTVILIGTLFMVIF